MSIIEPQTVLVFGAQDKGFMTGTEGHVVWGGEDGLERTSWIVGWNNPFIGDNSWRSEALRLVPYFPYADQSEHRYAIVNGGVGNNAEIRYELRPRN